MCYSKIVKEYQLELDKWGDTMKKISAIIIIFFILFIMFNTCMVQATVDPDFYNPTGGLTDADVNTVVNKVNPIIGTIKAAGIVIAVITLMVLGFKYMMGSVQEKAEYKKTMIPYLVGAILIVAVTQLVGLIADIVTNIKY